MVIWCVLGMWVVIRVDFGRSLVQYGVFEITKNGGQNSIGFWRAFLFLLLVVVVVVKT